MGHAGATYSDYDHPDLLRILRALDDYETWVSTRLFPIACKWIDEHREQVIEGMTEDEMNDVGAAIESAYRVLADSDWMVERQKLSAQFDFERASVNPLWHRTTEAFVKGEQAVNAR